MMLGVPMKRFRILQWSGFALLVLVVATLIALSVQSSPLPSARLDGVVAEMPRNGAYEPAAPPAPGGGSGGDFAREEVPADERMIVRNASLSLTVDDPAAKIAEIEALAAAYGGWVVSANISTSGSGDQQRASSASISIRVESARLSEALAQIKEGAGRVDAESVTGEDVTAQYIDVRSRLTNLEAAERQLQTILEEARRTEDVLAVFEQLTRLRGEIESMRGQMQYYERASTYSAIQVQLYATPVTPPVEVGGWRPLDTAARAAQALVDVVQGAVNVLIFVAVFTLPLLLIVGLPAWMIRRGLRRRRAAQAAG